MMHGLGVTTPYPAPMNAAEYSSQNNLNYTTTRPILTNFIPIF